MLKDLIKNNFNILTKKSYEERMPFDFRGELEIFGYRDGELFHYDKNDNVVTIWAKHAAMHLLTGEVFSQIGITRDPTLHGDTSGDSLHNEDGTMVSGEQFFSTISWPGPNDWWSRPVAGDSTTHLYPFFPVKMLFGTGFEWQDWATIGDSDYYTQYIADGWNSATYDSNISDAANNYSAKYDHAGDSLYKTRSINDIYSAALTTPELGDTQFAVKGAVKNGLYESEPGDSGKLETIGGNYFSTKAYRGLGRPAFIYAKREARFYQSGAEVALNFDTNVENKITFTITMPEQTGVNAGRFYPYNGFALKEAGLFCDSRFRLKDTTPPNQAGSDDSGATEFDSYSKMPYGVMFAKRYIAPITKSHDVSITARWTIYL